jgi:hypothetical protein
MWWDALLEPFRGKAVTIPPMDGALRPNSALEAAPALAELDRPDQIVAAGGRLLVSSGAALLELGPFGGAPVELDRFDAAITALAAFPDGGLAIGLESGEIVVRGGRHDGRTLLKLGEHRITCPTAIAVASETVIVVAEGSTRHKATDWIADLMGKGASGSVWRCDLSGGVATELANGLAWPAGLIVEPDHTVIVAEASRHRLIRLSGDGRGRLVPVLSELPGYPAGLTRAADGGAWLAVMAPRNRLVEFVLTEDVYRAEMVGTVERDFWIAPQITSGNSFLEPLQCGGVVTMGVRKPWAPGRSYGLVVKLDAAMKPVASLHSRADGRRHGIKRVAETDGALFVASKGGNVVLKVEGGRR